MARQSGRDAMDGDGEVLSVLTPGEAERIEAFRAAHATQMLVILFTDLVGGANIKSELGDVAAKALEDRHRELLVEALSETRSAQAVRVEGDSYIFVFLQPGNAIRFALRAQSLHRTARVAEAVLPEFRVGIHLGTVVVEDDYRGRSGPGEIGDIKGLQADTTARVMGLAKGGQILCTRAVFDDARQVLKGAELVDVGTLGWVNHGPYVLKGRDDTLDICEVGEEGIALFAKPVGNEKARPADHAEEELGWRPAVGVAVPNTDWTLVARLGEGAFGEVWLAEKARSGERRVFKFCFKKENIALLKREGLVLGRLKARMDDSPDVGRLSIVRYDDFAVTQEQPPYYIAMEYVPGLSEEQAPTLAAWLATNPKLTERLEIMAQVADGLHFAHGAGVLHRDVKPSNILVTRTREGAVRAKLIDFGLATADQDFLGSVYRSRLDASAGTPRYMAPEQEQGDAATPRGDIYSLGVTLYQVVVGDLDRRMGSGWKRNIASPVLRADIERATDLDPARRWESAAALADALRSHKGRRRRRWLVIGAAAALLVCVVGIAMRAGTRQAELVRQNRRLVQTLDPCDWSDQALRDLDETVEALRSLNREDGENGAGRVTRALEEAITGMIHQPVLGDDARTQIDRLLSRLAGRDAGRARGLSEAYQRRLASWQPIVSVVPPFTNLPAGWQGLPLDIDSDQAVLVPRGLSIRLPEMLEGDVKVQVEFTVPQTTNLSLSVGVLGTGAKPGYVLSLTGEARDAEGQHVDDSGLSGQRRPLLLSIERDGQWLTGSQLPQGTLSGNRVRMVLLREGVRLSGRVNESPFISVEEVFAVEPNRRGPVVLSVTNDTTIGAISIWRRQPPQEPSALERGDALFAAGKFSDAQGEYTLQMNAAADEATRREAAYKAAVCMLRNGERVSALKAFESLHAPPHDRWSMAGGWQAWRMYGLAKEFGKADEVFLQLRGDPDFKEHAMQIPQSERDALISAHWERVRGARALGRLKELGTHLERLERLAEKADRMGMDPYECQRLWWMTEQGYESLGGIHHEHALSLAKRNLETLEQDVIPGAVIPHALVAVRILLARGDVDEATRLADRWRSRSEFKDVTQRMVVLRGCALIADGRAQEAWASLREDGLVSDAFLNAGDLSGMEGIGSEDFVTVGLIAELAGQAYAAELVWKRGYEAVRPRKQLARGGILKALLATVVLGVYSEQMTEDEFERVMGGVRASFSNISKTYGSVDHSAVVTLMTELFGPELFRTVLTSSSGRQFISDYFLCRLPGNRTGELLPMMLATLITDRLAGLKTPSDVQQRIAVSAGQGLTDAIIREELVPPDLLLLYAASKGCDTHFGWGGVSSRLKPGMRRTFAYFLCLRYLNEGWNDKAARMLQTAREGADEDAEFAALLDAVKLPGKAPSTAP